VGDRRYLIAALICFTLAALIGWCGVAGAQSVIVLGGIGTSGHLGEENPGYEAQGIVAHRSGGFVWEGTATFDSAHKYTGAGYSLNAVGDVALLGRADVGLVCGAEYGYRNGGDFTKQTVWLRGGVEGRRAHEVIRVIARAELAATDDTRTKIVQVEYRRGWGRWWVTGTGGVVWYVQPTRQTGFYSALRVGYALKEDR
jgi:hypothetical protein